MDGWSGKGGANAMDALRGRPEIPEIAAGGQRSAVDWYDDDDSNFFWFCYDGDGDDVTEMISYVIKWRDEIVVRHEFSVWAPCGLC